MFIQLNYVQKSAIAEIWALVQVQTTTGNDDVVHVNVLVPYVMVLCFFTESSYVTKNYGFNDVLVSKIRFT